MYLHITFIYNLIIIMEEIRPIRIVYISLKAHVSAQKALLIFTYIFLSRMCAELPRKYIKDLLSNPSTLCECCKGEVIWINLS